MAGSILVNCLGSHSSFFFFMASTVWHGFIKVFRIMLYLDLHGGRAVATGATARFTNTVVFTEKVNESLVTRSH